MQYNEQELQWEGDIVVRGHHSDIKICNEYQKGDLAQAVEMVLAKIERLWPEILFSITHTFLNKINARRHFLKQPLIDEREYESTLKLSSVLVMEEMTIVLVFDDHGLSGNHRVHVSINSEGAVRAPEIDDWEEPRQIRGERVNVSLSNVFRPDQHEAIIREIEAEINEVWPDVESVLTNHLLSHYNDKIRDPNSPLMTQREFLAHIQLNGVHIMEDKSYDLYFIDNQLFNGKFIELFVDSDGTIYEPSLYH